ncbi:MAG: hypothetical protein Ct9H90mP4_12310 [Gammaproteobacteria bacterium]|nr:MAG: hypothetical protein Ct9H90mP4_12310 [Gammaproteobacteria bacterium]
MTELEFALNTFYLLMSGALVMWMAAGFTMLEAGLVRSKNASEIVTKNFGLFSKRLRDVFKLWFFLSCTQVIPQYHLGYRI